MTDLTPESEALLAWLEAPMSWMSQVARWDLLDKTRDRLAAIEARVRAEREGLEVAQRNVIGVAAGLDPAMDERLLRRLVGGLAMAARAALATPPAPEPKPQHGPWGNEGYCYCGTFVGHGDDRWGRHRSARAQRAARTRSQREKGGIPHGMVS